MKLIQLIPLLLQVTSACSVSCCHCRRRRRQSDDIDKQKLFLVCNAF